MADLSFPYTDPCVAEPLKMETISDNLRVAKPATTTTPVQPQQTRNWQTLNMKWEMDRRKTYERWPKPFMDPHRMAAAGFYYTNQRDVVRCAFCGIEVDHWEQEDDPFRDHQRWSASCGFVRGLNVGNVPINGPMEPQQPDNRSYDVCGPFVEIRPNSGPERGMSNGVHQVLTPEELQKHGINQSRGPMHPQYNTYEARLQTYESWPRSLKQKPDKLSEAGFYYTGKGDQTVCFHCGGGLKDWEETDDPWVEHAAWFPKCIHVVLIKGREFIAEVSRGKESTAANQDVKSRLSEKISSQSSSSKASASPSEKDKEPECKVMDDARMCQICCEEERGVVFLPCGHIIACVKCAPSLSTCAVCRQPFTGTVRAFLS